MTDAAALTEAERAALLEALDDEYRAVATYEAVIEDFGPVRPFVNIVESEQRHIEALTAILDRHGAEIPPNPWFGRVRRYGSVEEACAAGVEAEIDNAAMYDRLEAATARPEILRVFGNLRSASQQRHLPAFRRCAEGGRGPARGEEGDRGGRRRRRRRRGG